MKKDSFIVHKVWTDAIREQKESVRLEIYDAIIEYGIYGNEPDLRPIAKMAFDFIKPMIDRTNENYKEKVNSRSESGRIGNLKRWNIDLYNKVIAEDMDLDEAEVIANGRKNRNTSQKSQTVANGRNTSQKSLNVNDNVNVNVKDIVDFWNAKNWNLPKIQKLNQKRKTVINARIKDFDLKKIFEVIDSVENSKFLRGENNRNWITNFDWVMKSENFIKILEGNYSTKKTETTQQFQAGRR